MDRCLCYGNTNNSFDNYTILDIIQNFNPNKDLINHYSKNNKLILYLRDAKNKEFDKMYITTEELTKPTIINFEKYDFFCLKYLDSA
jgi:hypothetical protein